ncbi:dehydration-responsive element-binding protein 1A-like [Panicum virgatum]|uniref:dehydration-responsive element-binding protein 1A-like n=1 Tax=Panicum virgatum TaxID=38727 RepID=UPI0019D629E3|nr:dehydration-responsive element-binding protein 1A-like [Panicum virgatum]
MARGSENCRDDQKPKSDHCEHDGQRLQEFIIISGIHPDGNAGRWVCKVRVPGHCGCKLWLGTFDSAKAAARAHDAATLGVVGLGVCLNFADSAWLLAVPASYTSLVEVRRPVAKAVEEFRRRESLRRRRMRDQPRTSSTPSSPGSVEDEASTDGEESSPAADDSPFELDLFGDLSSNLYYTSLAQAMLMEPPSTVAVYYDEGMADVPLWSY